MSYNYVGLSTSHTIPKLETSWLGDRVLRWLVVAIWSYKNNVTTYIKVKSGRLEHEKLWNVNNIVSLFDIPKSIIFINDGGGKN